MNRQVCVGHLEATRELDVLVLGGGINGACLYDQLARQGYRVLLIDRGDFACGTSQASGMMAWGGLLYLTNLDFASVWNLSHERDLLIADKADRVKPAFMRYIFSPGGRSAHWMQMGLWFYWLMGRGRRHTPRVEDDFCERDLLKPEHVSGSLLYEEALLLHSDASFVLNWLVPHQGPTRMALNHFELLDATFRPDTRRWHVDLRDGLSGQHHSIQSALIVNCTGIWSDQVNATFGIRSPFRHILSKGVYLGLPRHAEHQNPLFFDLGEHQDVITHLPWGPVSLWGPTETTVESIEEGLAPTRDDVDFLLEHYARRYRQAMSYRDIISLRCGIRPLVVKRNDHHAPGHTLALSRRQEIVLDNDRPWISCYGGKMTDCRALARNVEKVLSRQVSATGEKSRPANTPTPDFETLSFPGITQPVASPRWCAEHTMCCTLDDYLRRRTNLSQWVPREGLGVADCHAQALREIALELAGGETTLAQKWLHDHATRVADRFDSLLRSGENA